MQSLNDFPLFRLRIHYFRKLNEKKVEKRSGFANQVIMMEFYKHDSLCCKANALFYFPRVFFHSLDTREL